MKREEEQQGEKESKTPWKERQRDRQTEVACVLAERFGGIEVIVNEGEFL